jgi:hypothetical protein
MSNKLHTGLWAATLVIALLGWTPLGQAAGASAAKIVPLAKVANFAKNAGALNGRKSSPAPTAGQIPVLDASGALPAGYQQLTESVPYGTGITDHRLTCPGGKAVLAGGFDLDPKDKNQSQNLSVFESHPTSGSEWRFKVRNTTGETGTVTLYVMCAAVAS